LENPKTRGETKFSPITPSLIESFDKTFEGTQTL